MILSHSELRATILEALTGECSACCMDDWADVYRTVSVVSAAILDKELDILSGIDNPVSER